MVFDSGYCVFDVLSSVFDIQFSVIDFDVRCSTCSIRYLVFDNWGKS